MQDNRFAPAPHFANAPDDAVGTASKGTASESIEPRGGGLQGAGAARAGGGVPVGAQTDAGVAAEPQAKNAAPTPRNASPAPEPVAKAFPESWREDLAGGDKAFRKTL